MNSQELRAIQEAYQQVYTPQELTEEAQIATEYFYQMGLNGSGIDILVEELGVDEFVEWVYDISDEYTLIETTRLQTKASEKNRILIGPKGSKPQSTTNKREKFQGGLGMSSSQVPSSIISKRKKATAKATTKQPETKSTPAQTRQGIGASVAGFLAKGIRRHNDANKTLNRNLSTMSAATKETARKIGDAASRFRAGFMGEEVENWVNALVEEGYDLSEYTWEEMYEMYVSEAAKRIPKKVRGAKPRDAVYQAGRSNAGKRISGDENTGPRYYTLGRARGAVPDAPTKPNEKPVNTPRLSSSEREELKYRRATLNKESVQGTVSGALNAGSKFMQTNPVGRTISNVLAPVGKGKPTVTAADQKRKIGMNVKEDLFDLIKGHLIDEGYADTEESAVVIMANMSEEWRQSIVEARVKKFDKPTEDDLDAVKDMPLSHNARMSANNKAIKDMKGMKNPNKLSGKSQLDAANKKLKK